jgi:hypothetical protein
VTVEIMSKRQAYHPVVDTEPMWKELHEVREREGDRIFRKVVEELGRRLGDHYDELHNTKHFTTRR